MKPYIIELENAVVLGLDGTFLPHFTNSAEDFTDVSAILLVVQQVTQVKSSDAFVVLV